jgi:small subunit ribosomal protein S1
VTGTVKSIDAKGAVIQLAGDIEGYLRASEVARDRVEDIRTRLSEGASVTVMIINIDRKNRTINLSIKAKDTAEEAEAMQRLAADKPSSAGTTNLGALLKAKLDVANTQQ